ncbi:MAG: DUF3849 domain-containing protein, partial [Symbiobacteriaceae bacterium]|nr:DUF3849 domain-containing protein [Symbiobacteriaceae bacterium]
MTAVYYATPSNDSGIPDDIPWFRSSKELNWEVIRAIDRYLEETHEPLTAGSRYNCPWVMERVISEYGYERTLAVLADMIRGNDDGRYSRQNREWSERMRYLPRNSSHMSDYYTSIHQTVMNACIDAGLKQLSRAIEEGYSGDRFVSSSDYLWVQLYNIACDTAHQNDFDLLRQAVKDTPINFAAESIVTIVRNNPEMILHLTTIVDSIRNENTNLQQVLYDASEARRVSIPELAERTGHAVFPRDNGAAVIIDKSNPDISLTVYPEGVWGVTDRADISHAVDFVRNFPEPSLISEAEAVSRVLDTVQTQTSLLPRPEKQNKGDWVTPEHIEDARAIPTERLAQALGYELKKDGRSSWRLAIDSSVVISNGLWVDYSPRMAGRHGGSAIDFMMNFHSPGMKLQEAVRRIHELCL